MKESVRVSVALCTFNGEKYITEQLESILSQTYPVSEIVIFDDASEDKTVEIVSQFISSSGVDIKLKQNEKRVGISHNFSQAIEHCTGDIIFLSDQDDIWLEDKVERFIEVFVSNDSAGAVFSDAFLVDEAGRRLDYSLFERWGFNDSDKKLFSSGRGCEVLVRKSVVTGATLAFKSQLKKYILPIPDLWLHDEWIALVSLIFFDLLPLDVKTIEYRQHGENVIGARKRTLAEAVDISKTRGYEYFIRRANAYELLLKLIDREGCGEVTGNTRGLIEGKIGHLRNRAIIQGSFLRKIHLPLSELLRGNYHRYSNGLRSFFRDLFL